ncbi:MAG: dihydrolipoyl dehydrogenase [Verrucomicrobiae bacterium]|nr:dihydrolipoyl dehydrogenase [Verrucomicrobiae bacterium]
METFDLVVIGAGPGGYPCAIRAAQLGASVAIIEREQLGGTCLNWGCIPTKALISGAELYSRISDATTRGIKATGVAIDYAALVAHKNRAVEQLRNGINQLLHAHGVKQFSGTARFVDRTTLEIKSADGTARLSAKKVVIATGSTSVMPAFLPEHPRVVESRAFLGMEELPESLLVLGGGYIGCELACMAAQCGVKVTIVELLEDILLVLDPDVRREVRTHMEQKLGIRVMTGRSLDSVAADGSGLTCKCGNDTLHVGMVLAAVGRRPVTDGLNLEAAGIKTDERGFVRVDEFGRTNVANIFAVGDVTGRVQLAHYATAQGIAVAETVCGQKPRKFESVVPCVIFTSPEIAFVGLTEEEARKQNRQVLTGKFRYSALGRAVAAGETSGFVKWIVDPETDQLLGAAAVGPHATELIAEAAVAVRAELTATELAHTIHAHPTFGEMWMEAAHAVHGQCIHAPPRRKK